ncbi:MAG: MBL fold metallo-hydrolase [Anaerolineales bacterium]|nr:MBL fold metallo-hydrolase [Anaerolineales bacterium]
MRTILRPIVLCATAVLLLASCSGSSPTSSVTLIYGEAAQVELITPEGRHIYIDIHSNIYLTQDPGEDDVLLITHLHQDHYYPSFVNAFPGQTLIAETGTLGLPDVTITAIASAHNTNDPIQDEGATNYIFIIETAGLRIVHFGDLGQEAFTAQQLAAIGAVDVAITQFSNSYSSMDASNLKGFHLMEQVQPLLIIPTHSDSDTIAIGAERWSGYYSETRAIVISANRLPRDTSLLILGNLASSYAALYELEVWR